MPVAELQYQSFDLRTLNKKTVRVYIARSDGHPVTQEELDAVAAEYALMRHQGPLESAVASAQEAARRLEGAESDNCYRLAMVRIHVDVKDKKLPGMKNAPRHIHPLLRNGQWGTLVVYEEA